MFRLEMGTAQAFLYGVGPPLWKVQMLYITALVSRGVKKLKSSPYGA